MSLKNKIDFAVVFKVKNANPNGDPLNGNRPRTSYNRIGEVSDVCIKRKIRNRLMEVKENDEYKYQIFVQSDDNKLDDCKNLRERAETVIDSNVFTRETYENLFQDESYGAFFSIGFDWNLVGRQHIGLDLRYHYTKETFATIVRKDGLTLMLGYYF